MLLLLYYILCHNSFRKDIASPTAFIQRNITHFPSSVLFSLLKNKRYQHFKEQTAVLKVDISNWWLSKLRFKDKTGHLLEYLRCELRVMGTILTLLGPLPSLVADRDVLVALATYIQQQEAS